MDYRYRPWVGKNFNKSNVFRTRLMILGESHYGYDNMEDDLKEVKNATKNLINYQLNGIERQKFLTAIYNICTETKISENIFWKSVLFYNYVQVRGKLMKPGNRPSLEQWVGSQELFLETIQKYKPEKLLVLGLSLWNNMPNDGNYLSIKDDIYLYPLKNNQEVITTFIYHPSRYPGGVERKRSSEVFKKLMKK